MATFESLPLELVLPITRQVYEGKGAPALLALSTIPAFQFSAQTLLNERIFLHTEKGARAWLATRNQEYVVKELVFEEGYTQEGNIAPATALEMVRACSPQLQRLHLGLDVGYAAIIGEPNIKSWSKFPRAHSSLFADSSLADIMKLSISFVPNASPHSLSFPSLRSLRISKRCGMDESRHEFNRRRFQSEGIIQLMKSASSELSSLALPALRTDSELDFVNAFRRFAGSLTMLKVSFGAFKATSPLHSILTKCSSLTSLDITVPSLALLRQLITQLPKSTLITLHYSSFTPCFLESFPDATIDMEQVLSLPQLSQLKNLQLDLMADEGYHPDGVEEEDPPGDEDGRFVGCLERWKKKGLKIEGAYQWGFDGDEE